MKWGDVVRASREVESNERTRETTSNIPSKGSTLNALQPDGEATSPKETKEENVKEYKSTNEEDMDFLGVDVQNNY